MVIGGGRQLLVPRVGQLRVHDARVAVAGRLLDVAAALEPVEQARDPGRRQQHLLCEVDAAHHPVGRAREPEEHLVVVDRQPVVGDELAVEPAHDRGVRADEVDERLHLDAFDENLRAHVVHCSSISGG